MKTDKQTTKLERPIVSVDVVLMGINNGELSVILFERKKLLAAMLLVISTLLRLKQDPVGSIPMIFRPRNKFSSAYMILIIIHLTELRDICVI